MNLHYFATPPPPLRSGYLHHWDPVTASYHPRKLSLPLSNSSSHSKINAQSLSSSNVSPKPPSLPSLLKTLNTTHLQSIPTETLGSLLSNLTPKEQTVVLKSQRNWKQLLLLFNHFKSQVSYTPNPIHYNIVLRTLGKAQKWDELRIYWIQMAKDGIFPTNNTYATLIDVFAKAGLVKESLLWVKHMKSRGVFPDEVTMNTVVRVLKDSGQFDLGEKFFKSWCDGRVELEILDLDFGESDAGVVSPKHFLLTEMFKSGGRVPILRSGSGLDQGSLRKNKPRLAATYNTLIDLYGKAGKLQNASDSFKEMLVLGIEPDAITFNTMIHICGSHGQLSEAESLLQKMEERRIKPDAKTFNIFMSLYASRGDIPGVFSCYRRIKEIGLRRDVVTYRMILQVICEEEVVQGVGNVTQDLMVSYASSMSNVYLSS
nr:pentatricopeptide repeat protein AaPPR1266 [Agave angustifolia]